MLSANFKTIVNESFDIYSPVKVTDDYGGDSIEYKKTEWNQQCRIYAKSGINKITVEGQEYRITAKAMIDKNCIVKNGDKIKTSTDNSTYMVLSVNNIFYEKTISHKEIILSRIEE